jgi:capsid portal protein
MLYTFGEAGAGQDFYPIPAYSSALNWVFLDGEQSFLHKNNIQNSIFPSLAIRRPKRFGSKKETEDFIDGLTVSKGAEAAGKVMVLTGDGMENTPEVVQISANNNDNLFTQTSKEIKDNICFAHKINPSIMGIKVQGSLGNAQELEMSYTIFEKNVVKPMRAEIEKIFSDLLRIAELDGKLVINGYKIVGEEIVEEDAIDNKTGELLNAMSPLLANKVLENLTINETRALAGLKPIQGGDKLPETNIPQE